MGTKKLSLIGIFILLTGFFNSCILLGPSVKGNGNVTEEERNVGNFDKIKVTTGMNVLICQGEQTKVTVVADENLHDRILTEVSGRTLKIAAEARIRRAKEKKVLVIVPDLERIMASAGANVSGCGVLNFGDLEISASAGSNLSLELSVKELKVKTSSGSNIILKGNVYDLNLKASSGSNLKAKNLEASECKAEASSGADIYITVLKQLDGNASSGGTVTYYGNPEKIKTHTSSGGNIIRKQ